MEAMSRAAKRLFAGVPKLRIAMPSVRRQPSLPVRAEPLPEQLPREVQWSRVTAVVTEAAERVETVHALQRSAEQQLDAATYAIQRLFAELAEVVRLPAPSESSTSPAGRAVVVPLQPSPVAAAGGHGALAA